MNEQPHPTAQNVLPMLNTQLGTIHTQIDGREAGGGYIRPGLAKFELVQLPRAAEGAMELIHSRTGNGPPPDSSSMWPVSKRDNAYALMRSGGVPVATKVAKAAPDAGIALNPP